MSYKYYCAIKKKGEQERNVGFLPCRAGANQKCLLFRLGRWFFMGIAFEGVWPGGNPKVMPNCATAKALFLVTRWPRILTQKWVWSGN